MNPNPLASLNHFTVPVRIDEASKLLDSVHADEHPQQRSELFSTAHNEYNNYLT
jgi:hypothetical protein